MNMYILLAFLLLFVPLFFHVPNEKQTFSFMSMEYTTTLRAVAILMIMQQHLSGFVFGSRIFTPFGGWSCYILDYQWIWINGISKKEGRKRLLEKEIR